MNYSQIYHNLITRGQTRQVIEGAYMENHHIVPRCMGGTDDSSNLVRLTPEEHYLAHLLLMKIYPSNVRLVHAAFMMTVGSCRNNKLYGWLKRKRFSEPMSEETKQKIKKKRALQVMSPRSEETKQKMRGPNPAKANRGEKNGFFGKHHTEETKKILAEKCPRKGRTHTQETIAKLKETYTPERRAALSKVRSELNKKISEQQKQATVQSNKQRGINKQKIKIRNNIDLYTQIFDLLSQGVAVKEVAKTLNAPYHLVWNLQKNREYYYTIYQEVLNEQ